MCGLLSAGTLGSHSHLANENGTITFCSFFFFWRRIFWIKPISHSHECYISVNSRGQTVVEQKGCKVDFYGDERKQNTKSAHTFLGFLRIVL